MSFEVFNRPRLRIRGRITRRTVMGTPKKARNGIPGVGARLAPLIRIIRITRLLRDAGSAGLDYDAFCRALVCSPRTIRRDIHAMNLCGFEIVDVSTYSSEAGGREPARFVLKSDPFERAA